MKLGRFAWLLPLLAFAAQPPASPDVDRRLRAAEEAWRRGDDAAAIQLYGTAEERSRDPGQIAFNLGAIHFRKGEFREAELQFQRALDDREAPAGRRARAFFNRGVCLLRQGGLTQYRAAIENFVRCSAIAESDAELERHAGHNLELAKLLWLEARAKSSVQPLPNERPPEEPPEAPRPPKPEATDPKPPDANGTNTTAEPKPGEIDPVIGKPKADGATGTKKTVGGKGNLPVNGEWAGWRPQDETEAREYLKSLGPRLAKDRRDLIDLSAPPEQPHVKNW